MSFCVISRQRKPHYCSVWRIQQQLPTESCISRSRICLWRKQCLLVHHYSLLPKNCSLILRLMCFPQWTLSLSTHISESRQHFNFFFFSLQPNCNNFLAFRRRKFNIRKSNTPFKSFRKLCCTWFFVLEKNEFCIWWKRERCAQLFVLSAIAALPDVHPT